MGDDGDAKKGGGDQILLCWAGRVIVWIPSRSLEGCCSRGVYRFKVGFIEIWYNHNFVFFYKKKENKQDVESFKSLDSWSRFLAWHRLGWIPREGGGGALGRAGAPVSGRHAGEAHGEPPPAC